MAGDFDCTPAEVDCTPDTVDGPHGPIPVRIYRPSNHTTARGPVLIWSHGGGWVGGDLDMLEADRVARLAAARLPGVVVSVGYRLAPTFRHPVAMDEVATVIAAVQDDPDRFGADPERIAAGGASAGAHLTAAAIHGLARRPRAIMLVYPCVDPIDGPYPSARPAECPEGLWFTPAIVEALFANYAADGRTEPPLAPAKADLHDLPPHLVTTAGLDSLRDQAVRYVELLRAAGVDATHHDEPRLFHGYANEVGNVAAATRAVERHIDWLRDALGAD